MDSSEVKKVVQVHKNDEKAYCTLCKVLLRAGALDDHLKGKKHKRKQEKTTMPNMVIQVVKFSSGGYKSGKIFA